MANKKRFDGKSADQEVATLYEKYLESGNTIETTALSNLVSPSTLREAFVSRGLELKINRTVSKSEAIELQKAGGYPLDYVAAKLRLHENTVRKWIKVATGRRRKGTTHRAAKMFWHGLNGRCETPADFLKTLVGAPHFIRPRDAIAIYHRRIKPPEPILWQLDSPQPAEYLDEDEVAELAGATEHESPQTATLYLGQGTVVHPLRWTEGDNTTEHAMTAETEEMAHLQSILEDL